jgi:hypothetical protein
MKDREKERLRAYDEQQEKVAEISRESDPAKREKMERRLSAWEKRKLARLNR